MRLGEKVSRRYRLTDGPISGGTGEVWLAHDDELGRDVALKRVRTEGTGTAGFDRLRAEARALARFHHPRVVTLYDAVRHDRLRRTTSWLVMEYVPGGGLDRRPPFPVRLAAHVGAQIADALAALHAEGLVHCDVKPGNVVAAGDASVKLADFGATYRVGGRETITHNSTVGFTPGFAAPEVVEGRQPEPACDVFSLGATVYALIAGKPPRRGGPAGHRADDDSAGRWTPQETDPYLAAREAVRGEVEIDADVGPLRELLTAMLRRRPEQRPDLAAVRERLEAVAGRPEDLPPFPGREPDAGTTHRPHGSRERRRLPFGLPAVLTFRLPYRLPGGRAAVVATAAATALALAGWAVADGLTGKPSNGRSPAAGRSAHSSSHGSSGASRGTPGAASSVIGDHQTADPCALARPEAFGRFGSASLSTDYGNFNRCDVLVRTGHESVVDAEFEFVDGVPDLPARPRTTGRVGVVSQSPDDGECDRLLLLSGVHDMNVTITVKTVDGRERGSSFLCGVADTAANSAAGVLNRVPAKGEIARRSPAPPANSLFHQDACTLLGSDALPVVPGLNLTDPDPGFGNWDCSWGTTDSDTWVQLRFDRSPPPNAQDGTVTRLGGRYAVVVPGDDGPDTCLVQVVTRTFTDVDGETTAEMVELTVGGSGSADQLRGTATRLATLATAGLPAG